MKQNNIIDLDNDSNISVINKDISIEDFTEISTNQEEEEDEILNYSLDFNKSVKNNLNLLIENEKYNNQLEIIPQSLNKLNPPKISKLKPKQIIEPVSPMKLNLKLFENDNSENKKINDIVYDFSLNQADAKSCNDEITSENEIEEFTLNLPLEKEIKLEEIKFNINEIRKDMKNYKSQIENNYKSKEFEYILNSDKIFNRKKYKLKKKSIFKKYIQFQEETNWLFSSMGPLASLNGDNNQRTISLQINRSNTLNTNYKARLRNSNISILGILESVVNERKRRNTVNFK